MELTWKGLAFDSMPLLEHLKNNFVLTDLMISS